MALRFTVLDASWTADGQEFPAGDTTVDDPTPGLVKLAGSAHAAGVIDVTEGLDVSHVQSQEDGEAAYAQARIDGSWQEGNLLQHQLDEAQKAADAQATSDSGGDQGGETPA